MEYVLVVTKPAPESTSRLEPEVVTPNAAKAIGMKPRKQTREALILGMGKYTVTSIASMFKYPIRMNVL